MADLHLLSPKGFVASGVYAGIKSKKTPDVGLLVSQRPAAAAAVFTTNQVFAAPVAIGKKHIQAGKLRGIVVNSGNANACTGKQGEKNAIAMCKLASGLVGADPHEFLPSSTGIIGHQLPMEKVNRGIEEAGKVLGDSAEHAQLFTNAIMTTDLKRKGAAVEFKIGRQKLVLAGVCKGSGMIGPRLAVPHATMLAYLTTDAQVSPAVLKRLMQQAADVSFNNVTVDDQASTNDTCCILASGASGVKVAGEKDVKSFTAALTEVCQSLAYQIAADGEGATKVIEVIVRNAKSEEAAKVIARSIANSPLVKCAVNGNDPNWGRVLCAAGMTEAPFDPAKATLTLQGTVVFRNGAPATFDAARVSAAMKVEKVVFNLDCRLGKGASTCWTCDLSKEYVTINADYHT
jgi:glutamate N-acetyltransferase / amino-acid N-acetyltransferase